MSKNKGLKKIDSVKEDADRQIWRDFQIINFHRDPIKITTNLTLEDGIISHFSIKDHNFRAVQILMDTILVDCVLNDKKWELKLDIPIFKMTDKDIDLIISPSAISIFDSIDISYSLMIVSDTFCNVTDGKYVYTSTGLII